MSEVLTTKQLCERWGVHENTVREWRMKGIGPPYFRPAPNGKVLYRLEAVEQFEREREGAV